MTSPARSPSSCRTRALLFSKFNQRVEHLIGPGYLQPWVEDSAGMDAVFHALSHEARRTMLRRLSAGDLTVGELAEPLTMSFAAASKHVKVLENAGLVARTVTGRRHVCRLEPGLLADATSCRASTNCKV